MKNEDCVAFLRWALPRLRLRWPGFRRVRRQVCKRIARRCCELGLEDVAAYRTYLEAHEEEWRRLDGFCRIPISRFYRDRGVFDDLGGTVLPALGLAARARGAAVLRAWSAGCASGEEPFSLALLWRFAVAPDFPGLGLEVVASDVDRQLLERARRGEYGAGSLRELPAAWRAEAFQRRGALYCLRPAFRRGVAFRRQDLRETRPREQFDLVLCRNLAFTYFDEALQREVLARLVAALRPGGALILGRHERLPPDVPGLVSGLVPGFVPGFVPWAGAQASYRRTARRTAGDDPGG